MQRTAARACTAAIRPQIRHMNAHPTIPSRAQLALTHLLARLLERLERSPVPVGAEQYRSVVLHLAEEFNDLPPGADLGALLDAHPAAAELYENLHYAHAGLCRHPLGAAAEAELLARQVIDRARRGPAGE
jgi:hypothetical protein